MLPLVEPCEIDEALDPFVSVSRAAEMAEGSIVADSIVGANGAALVLAEARFSVASAKTAWRNEFDRENRFKAAMPAKTRTTPTPAPTR